MEMILASLSLALALISVWFTAQALSRAESHGDTIVKPHIRLLNARIKSDRSVVDDIDRRLRRIEREIQVLKIDSHTTQNLKAQTRGIREAVDDKRKFIPSRVMTA